VRLITVNAPKLISQYITGQYKIPAGITIFIQIYMLHRNPEYYPNPEELNPHILMFTFLLALDQETAWVCYVYEFTAFKKQTGMWFSVCLL
jgi:hypothetical protein